ncbi:MAG: uvrD [Rickettsiaceae bacterium]|jgi:ATP-dependent helicase/nuclease subunit A|nr:uvrD [Rickettsiaceae bacterium]
MIAPEPLIALEVDEVKAKASPEPLLNYEQLHASNPDTSVWVSASAGTGKTKILTDRVLRLLINGVKPEKILCITFTKAAAGEMNNRINKELSVWANLSSVKLEERLKSSFGHPPTREQLNLASQLFHEKLSSVENLKIQTIHSFCQFILGRFPVEAGISPGFKVIDEYKRDEILKQIRINLIVNACERPDSELGNSVEFIASHLHENTIYEIIKEVINNKTKFYNLFNNFKECSHYERELRKIFVLSEYQFETNIIERLLAGLNYLNIELNLEAIDKEIYGKEYEVLKRYFEYKQLNLHQQVANFENFCSIFLTQTGEVRKTIFNKKFRCSYPEIDEKFNKIMLNVLDTCEQIKSLNIIFFSKHLFSLANFIINNYEEHKTTHAYLDFDDLIYYTSKLLTNSEAREWVLYKLDGFVEHILVDEAQDTNFEQWQIIEALAREFYAGVTRADSNRTLFVVGDEKQSIYSFQGADPASFTAMNCYFKDKMLAADKRFATIDLSWSYRSLDAINIAVTKVFERIKKQDTALFSNQNLSMKCFRQGGGGRIEIWPLVIKQSKESNLFWPLPDRSHEYETTDLLLAEAIAHYIHSQISSKKYLASRKRTVNASDFIILVKQRDEFSKQVINELNKLHVKVAGIDRMSLLDNLAIKDILCLAKFVLLPNDDLNLACLLKSPFVGLPESTLYSLAVKREGRSIWQALKESPTRSEATSGDLMKKAFADLSKFLEIYKVSSFTEFFRLILDALGFREKILIECGLEASEIVNEFLDLAANFERENGNNLQDFIIWVENSHIEIKRDLEQGDSLRVMTVHGSKGLQAPFVILADTTRIGRQKPKLLWTEENHLLWPGYSANENEFYKALEEKYKHKDYQEYLRLLYVAMTRAEDELIIFGSSEKEDVADNCWYSLIKEGLKDVTCEAEIPVNLTRYFAGNSKYLHFDLYSEKVAPLESVPLSSNDKYIPLMDTTPKFFLKTMEEQQLTQSPLISRQATEYGTVIHRLLEAYFTAKDLNFVINHPILEHLNYKQVISVREKLSRVAELSEIKQLLKYNLKCEVTVGMNDERNSTLGRLDLLAINNSEAVIIDYKTDSHVPSSVSDVPNQYQTQLKHYKQIITELYPEKIIRTKIFWFENLSFMELYL